MKRWCRKQQLACPGKIEPRYLRRVVWPIHFDFGLSFLTRAETADLANLLAVRLGDDEPSFVKVFKLPDWSGPYSIQVTSYTYGGATDPVIFYPRYVLLDKNSQQTRQSVAKDFVYRGAGAQGAVSTTVFLNEEKRD